MQKKSTSETQTSLHKEMLANLTGQVIAHRGAPKEAPENTKAGFNLAAEKGAKWLEFDAQCCASGEWVIIHDYDLERTTNGHGGVAETPLELLKHLDAGSWFHSFFKNQRIPTLSETLRLLQNLNLRPNIEIKFPPMPNKTSAFAKKSSSLQNFVTLLEREGLCNPPLISSFDLETLEILKNMAPHLPRGLIVDQILENTLEEVERLECFSLHCNYESLQKEEMESLLTHKIPILLFTINDPVLAKYYLDLGVTAIFSDYPNLLSFYNRKSSTKIESS